MKLQEQRGEAEMLRKERLTGRERERVFIFRVYKTTTLQVCFFFFNLILKRRRFGTDIKINIRLQRRRFGIVELIYRNPTYYFILSCAVSPSASAFLSQTLTF